MHEFENAAYTMRRQAAQRNKGLVGVVAMRGYQQSCNGRLHTIEEQASAGILTLAFRFKRIQKDSSSGDHLPEVSIAILSGPDPQGSALLFERRV